MYFKTKHSFFKIVVWHTSSLKNVLLTLAQRHQILMAHQLYMWSFPKSPVEVSNVSSLPIDVLKEDIAFALKQRHILSQSDAQKLVHKCFTSRPDYCNSLLLGYPTNSLKSLQLIQNTAARVLMRSDRRHHVSPI